MRFSAGGRQQHRLRSASRPCRCCRLLTALLLLSLLVCLRQLEQRHRRDQVVRLHRQRAGASGGQFHQRCVVLRHPSGSTPTREKVAAQLEQMNEYDVGGFWIGFSPSNRVGSRFVEVTVIGPGGKPMR